MKNYQVSSNIHESPLAKNTYDLVFSLGEKCSCASSLSASLLREYSCPFDWVAGASFEQRIDILLNDFNVFFEKDKLELREWPSKMLQRASHISYTNKENNINFTHDFPQNESSLNLDNVYFPIREKYDRRTNRLLNILNTKNLNILCVYIQEKIIKILNNEIISLHDKLRQKFKANIDMLFVRYEPSFRMDELTLDILTRGIFIASLNNKHTLDWKCNDRMLSLLLDNINTKQLLQIKNSSITNALYIYGAGEIGKAIAGRLARRNIDFNGFIVSDNQEYINNSFGKVYPLKKLPIPYSEATVIFALNRQNMSAVKEYLQNNGIEFGYAATKV